MESSTLPKDIDIGIHNRVSGLNLCFEKLDEKITKLMVLTECLKDEAALRSSVSEISKWKTNLENVKQRMNERLIEYKAGGCQKEDYDNIIKKLKDLIIEVYETKCTIDLAFGILTNIKGDDDEKGKGLVNDDAGVKYYGESSHTGTEIDFAALGLSSSSTEEESEERAVEFERKDGDVRERFLGKLAQTSSSRDDLGQQLSDSELFSSNVEGLDQEFRDLICGSAKNEE